MKGEEEARAVLGEGEIGLKGRTTVDLREASGLHTAQELMKVQTVVEAGTAEQDWKPDQLGRRAHAHRPARKDLPRSRSIRSFGKWIAAQQSRLKTHPHKQGIECAILFVAGFIMDGILSLDTIVTAHNAWIAAGATSLTVTFLSYAVFPYVVDEGKIVNWAKLCSLGLGCAVGAMLVTGLVTGP